MEETMVEYLNRCGDDRVKRIVCNVCGNELPEHTVRQHLTDDPILECPHREKEQ